MKEFGDSHDELTRITLLLFILFFVVFNFAAIALQIESGESPNTSGTVVDKFNGGVLWMASMVALLTAALRYPDYPRFFLWLAISAGAGALSIDEVFEKHEWTATIVGDDDYVKVAMMVMALTGLILLYRLERPRVKVTGLFLLGFVFHCCYLATDLGDGDFFQLPFEMSTLHWAEELFEMLANQFYFSALVVFFISQAQPEFWCGEKNLLDE
jgi:hypothetical protein